MKIYRNRKNNLKFLSDFKNIKNKIRELINKSLLYKIPTKICSSILLFGMYSTSTLRAKAVISADDVTSNGFLENANIEEMPDIDLEYMILALNLQDPYILLYTGIAENFRFLDGDKEKIKIGKFNNSLQWLYNRDSGKGSTNVMRCLFPCSAREFNEAGGLKKVNNFTEDCNPTPEMIAKIIGICYKLRNDNTFETRCSQLEKHFGLKIIKPDQISKLIKLTDKIKTIEKKIEDIEKEILSCINTVEEINNSISKTQEENAEKASVSKIDSFEERTMTKEDYVDRLLKILSLGENYKKTLSSIKLDKETEKTLSSKSYTKSNESDIQTFANSTKKALDEKIKKLKRNKIKKEGEKNKIFPMFEIQQNINDFFREFEENYILESDPKKTSTILNLILNIHWTIKNQEKISDKDNSKFLPKYTTEKMLMTYFVKRFNSKDDINKFYETVLDLVKKPSSFIDTKTLEVEKQRLKDLNELLNSFKQNKKNPYKSILQQNGKAFDLLLCTEKECKFSKEGSFQDCVEMSIRHILTILIYSQTESFDRITLSDEEKIHYDKLLSNIKGVLKIENFDTPLEYLPFRNRLRIFSYYQQQNENKNVDDTSSISRNIWNYVVSNTNKNVEEGMFLLNYRRNNSNELKSGLLNNLKFIYNAAYALRIDLNIKDEQLKSAKNKIETLIFEIESQEVDKEFNNKKQVEECIKSVYGLINNKIENVVVTEEESFKIFCCPNDYNEQKHDISVAFNIKINDKKETENSCPFLFSVNSNKDHSKVAYDQITNKNNKIEILASKDNRKFGEAFYNKKTLRSTDKSDPTFINLYEGSLSITNCDNIFPDSKEYFGRYRFFKDFHVEPPMNSTYFFEVVHDYFRNEGNGIVSSDNNTIEEFFEQNLRKICDRYDHYRVENDLIRYVNSESTAKGFLSILGKKDEMQKALKSWRVKNSAFSGLRIGNSKIYTVPKQPVEKIIFSRCAFGNSDFEIFHIPDTTTKITFEKETFFGSKINTVKFPENMESLKIDTGTFQNCKIKNIVWPKNLKSLIIYPSAFENCKNLENIKFPDSIENLEIKTNALKLCENLKKVEFPKSLKHLVIEKNVFHFCKNLNEVQFSNPGLESQKIDEQAFENFSKLNLPNFI